MYIDRCELDWEYVQGRSTKGADNCDASADLTLTRLVREIPMRWTKASADLMVSNDTIADIPIKRAEVLPGMVNCDTSGGEL